MPFGCMSVYDYVCMFRPLEFNKNMSRVCSKTLCYLQEDTDQQDINRVLSEIKTATSLNAPLTLETVIKDQLRITRRKFV